MIKTVHPGPRTGQVRIPASKSQAHRLLICAALGTGETSICCDGISRDIAATVQCLRALGAEIRQTDPETLHVRPIGEKPLGLRALPCGESGSTLRFLMPLVGALGAEAVFLREGRLPERPLAPFDQVLRSHGMSIRREGERLFCSGRLLPGDYSLPGNVSSQYISGLLMALPLLPGESRLEVTGAVESAAYIRMTEDALALSGIQLTGEGNRYGIPGTQRPALPGRLQVEGDWSNAAFFLALGALSPRGIRVTGLNLRSSQGDRAVLRLLRGFGAELTEGEGEIIVRSAPLHGQVIDAASVPDLIPVLSVVAAAAEGETRIINAGRLRLKESDRLRSTAELLESLGARVRELESGLVISGGKPLRGGEINAFGDHRIAMSAAVAASLCRAEVKIPGAECVEKSYPRFWEDFEQLELRES